MKKVTIESPYAGDIDQNVEYACRAMRDSLNRGEAPLASHLLYTQEGILDDNIPEERQQGIDAGMMWNAEADLVAAYTDYGISSGMLYGLESAVDARIPRVYRKIGKNPERK